MQSAVTVVSHISHMSPSVTVISLPLYRVHKTFGSRSLQTHMRSENQIFNDQIKKNSTPTGHLHSGRGLQRSYSQMSCI